MSTRSNIAYKINDKQVKVIYCHWDGGLSNVGQTLVDCYDTPNKVKELVDFGNISSLGETLQECEVDYSREKGGNVKVSELGKYRDVKHGDDERSTIMTLEKYSKLYKENTMIMYYYLYDGKQWLFKIGTDLFQESMPINDEVLSINYDELDDYIIRYDMENIPDAEKIKCAYNFLDEWYDDNRDEFVNIWYDFVEDNTDYDDYDIWAMEDFLETYKEILGEIFNMYSVHIKSDDNYVAKCGEDTFSADTAVKAIEHVLDIKDSDFLIAFYDSLIKNNHLR